jgi:hypothetical protein
MVAYERRLCGSVTVAPLTTATAAAVTAATTTTAATVTATAATATTATAVTAAATAAVTAAATTAAAFLAWTSFVDRQGPALDFLAVQAGYGRPGFLIAAHLDEPKSLAAAGVAVGDDLRAADRTESREQLLQVGATDTVAQISNVQLPSHDKSP